MLGSSQPGTARGRNERDERTSTVTGSTVTTRCRWRWDGCRSATAGGRRHGAQRLRSGPTQRRRSLARLRNHARCGRGVPLRGDRRGRTRIRVRRRGRRNVRIRFPWRRPLHGPHLPPAGNGGDVVAGLLDHGVLQIAARVDERLDDRLEPHASRSGRNPDPAIELPIGSSVDTGVRTGLGRRGRSQRRLRGRRSGESRQECQRQDGDGSDRLHEAISTGVTSRPDFGRNISKRNPRTSSPMNATTNRMTNTCGPSGRVTHPPDGVHPPGHPCPSR